jgi:hypothetical protein
MTTLILGGSCFFFFAATIPASSPGSTGHHQTSRSADPFTADQLLTALKEASHTVIFIEHDPTLFDGADRLLIPVAAALRDAGHEALVILYAPVMDRSFAALVCQADRLIEIVHTGEPTYNGQYQDRRSHPQGRSPAPAQKTLEVF